LFSFRLSFRPPCLYSSLSPLQQFFSYPIFSEFDGFSYYSALCFVVPLLPSFPNCIFPCSLPLRHRFSPFRFGCCCTPCPWSHLANGCTLYHLCPFLRLSIFLTPQRLSASVCSLILLYSGFFESVPLTFSTVPFSLWVILCPSWIPVLSLNPLRAFSCPPSLAGRLLLLTLSYLRFRLTTLPLPFSLLHRTSAPGTCKTSCLTAGPPIPARSHGWRGPRRTSYLSESLAFAQNTAERPQKGPLSSW